MASLALSRPPSFGNNSKMSRVYDNWEKLVGAVLRREKDRQLVYCESFSTRCSSDLDSAFSLGHRLRDAMEAVIYGFESREQLEAIMTTLGREGVHIASLTNEASKLRATAQYLQGKISQLYGRRRQTDTAKSIYVASDFMEQQPDIDDDDDDDGELQSLPQEKEPETGERSAEEKATENYGSLLKGKNVLKRPPNKHTKTVRHDLDRSAEDAAMKSDEPEEPGEVTGEGSMEENESPQPEFEAEEKSPVKDEEANNEPENTMSNVFSTPVSKTMEPGKRGPNRLAQAPLQRAGAEKKPMSSIADVVESSGRSKVSRNNGIRGMRPTIVVPSWDRGAYVPRLQSGFFADKVGNEEVGRNRSEKEKDMRIQIVPREENCTLWESCSFTSSNERCGLVIHDWQKGELLGRGTFGSVYEGIADGGFFFAVKEVSLLDQGVEGKQCIIQLEQEIALLSQFEHENIVRYYGTEKDATHLYIFLELVTQGSLLRLYQKYDLRVPQVSGYTRQILHGLKYLHDRNVIHRDIKCANILVHTNGLVKLADFGLAKAAKLNDVKSCKGTAFWMAPEVVRSKGYGLAADIWSLGCTVLEMLTRSFPFSGLEYMTALYKIGQGERPFVPGTLSSDARDFILQCLQVNPSLRPTAAQLLDHPFVKRPLPSSSGVASAHSFGWQF